MNKLILNKNIMKIVEEGTQCTVDMEDGIIIPFNKVWGSFHFTGSPYGDVTVLKDEFNDKRYEDLTVNVKDNTVEVDPTGDVILSSGTGGSVTSITVDGAEILSGTVVFNTSLAQTAIDIVDSINAGPRQSDYLASIGTATQVIIKALFEDKIEANGYAIVSTTTVDIVTADTNMSGGISAAIGDMDAVRAYLSGFVG